MEDSEVVEVITKKKKFDKNDDKIFSKAIKKAATKELEIKTPIEGTLENNFTYYRTTKKTVVEILADQIIELALDPGTSLKDKMAIYEKFAKITEGDKKEVNKNISVGYSESYERFLEEVNRKRLGNGN